jgi:DUF971 family protein
MPTEASLPIPTQLDVQAAAELVAIDWEDGHRSTYPWWYLRGFCPCAVCQGHSGPTRFIETDAAQLGDVDEVGQYALRLIWDKNHATGIYTFSYLRTLCLCKPCRAAAGERHPIHALSAAMAQRLP